MPFEIVCNDIVNMQVDAIVNTATPKPIVGYGVDTGIHKKAGPGLLAARQKIGRIPVGQAAVTPAFELDARIVIHTVGPVWQGGGRNEERLLQSCYENSLKLALENKCESIAFPLISAGNHGVPKALALQTAVRVFSSFLMTHEMRIYLVVFSRDALALSEKLFDSVARYIDENYIREKKLDEYGLSNKRDVREEELLNARYEMELYQATRSVRESEELSDFSDECADYSMAMPSMALEQSLEDALWKLDSGFSETLLKLIDRSGKKDSEIYKKANVDRKLFSKIRNNKDYKPSKSTALAFAIALELDLEDTKDLIGRAGYALSHSSKFDVILEYFIAQRNYDIFELNEVLFKFDQPLLGC